MKKRNKELNLNDLKYQIIIGITILLLVFLIGIISINNNLKTCDNSNFEGSLNDIRPIIQPPLPIPTPRVGTDCSRDPNICGIDSIIKSDGTVIITYPNCLQCIKGKCTYVANIICGKKSKELFCEGTDIIEIIELKKCTKNFNCEFSDNIEKILIEQCKLKFGECHLGTCKKETKNEQVSATCVDNKLPDNSDCAISLNMDSNGNMITAAAIGIVPPEKAGKCFNGACIPIDVGIA
ncbi:MAG: hypothetical protein WC867_08000 [Candidatus Pacearchaeota archaeon]|jgi:hypothetical protein